MSGDPLLPFEQPVAEPEWLQELEAESLRQQFHLPRGYLSWAQFDLHSACPACYEAVYINNVRLAQDLVLFFGGAVHVGTRLARTRLRNHEPLDMEEIEQAVIDSYRDDLAGRGPWGNGEPARIGSLGKFKSPAAAEPVILDLVRSAVARVVSKEDPEMYLGLEAEVDFTGIFPFKFLAYVDALLASPYSATGVKILEDKTTVGYPKPPSPEYARQLTTYALPWLEAGDVVEAQVNQYAAKGTKKLGPGPIATVYPVKLLAEESAALKAEIILHARTISAGLFPVSRAPAWMHRIDHGLPRWRKPEE